MSWEVRGDRALFERLREEWERLADDARSAQGPRDLDGVQAYVKASRLTPRAGRRHAVRRAFLRVAIPRLAEFENLAWLRRHGFGAPEPLVAAARWSGARPDFQALATAIVADARPLAEHLNEGSVPDGAAARLGAEVARMHAQGFVHRDLFVRNLLLDDAGAWTFLDAWRGGTRRGSRGPAWDVACLLEEELLPAEFAAAFLEAYRAAAGEVPAGRLERERGRVRRRFRGR